MELGKLAFLVTGAGCALVCGIFIAKRNRLEWVFGGLAILFLSLHEFYEHLGL